MQNFIQNTVLVLTFVIVTTNESDVEQNVIFVEPKSRNKKTSERREKIDNLKILINGLSWLEKPANFELSNESTSLNAPHRASPETTLLFLCFISEPLH